MNPGCQIPPRVQSCPEKGQEAHEAADSSPEVISPVLTSVRCSHPQRRLAGGGRAQ